VIAISAMIHALPYMLISRYRDLSRPRHRLAQLAHLGDQCLPAGRLTMADIGHAARVEDVPVTGEITIPASELGWRFSRSSGPGGQGVNTTDSRVELSWDLAASDILPAAVKERAERRLAHRLTGGVLTVTASEFRSQLRNRQAAMERLADLVVRAIAAPRPPRRATRPTRGSVERRIAGKKRRGEIKRRRRGDAD
jgi:ribosome-associated protein